jgi:hypothetical protein
MPSPPIGNPGLEFSLGGPPKAFKKKHDISFNKKIGTLKVLILSAPAKSYRVELSPNV